MFDSWLAAFVVAAVLLNRNNSAIRYRKEKNCRQQKQSSRNKSEIKMKSLYAHGHTRSKAHTCKTRVARWISFQISICLVRTALSWKLVTKNLYLGFLVYNTSICKCIAYSIQMHAHVKFVIFLECALFLKFFLISEKLAYFISKLVNLLKISRYGNPTHA